MIKTPTGTRTVFITKYALTKGIFTVQALPLARQVNDPVPPWESAEYASTVGGSLYKMGIAAFLTEEEAIQAADKQRQKKVASLKKQIDRLENLTFAIKAD